MSLRRLLTSTCLALGLSFSSCGDEPCAEGDACRRAADAGSRAVATDADRPDARGSRVVNVDSACVAQSVRATRRKRPVDAIFVIDNSGSMADEIAAVRESINDDFAAIIDKSGVDLRVIVISRFGSESTFVCVEPPLSGGSCGEGLERSNSERFYHYDLEVGSHDALCYLLASFDQPDQAGRAPMGWKSWLRAESAKAFVIVSDDSPRCAYREGGKEVSFGAGATPEEDALLFHQTLLRKAPEYVGAPPDTRYQVFSIVGLAGTGSPGEPLLPHVPLDARACDTAMSPGLTYQALSIATDALRYPVCEGRSFDRVFEVLARSVVEVSSADCVFEMPKQSASGEPIDPSTVNIVFQPTGGEPRQFVQVAEPKRCDEEGSFYIDRAAGRIELCPAACAMVKRDRAPEVKLLYGCEVFVQ